MGSLTAYSLSVSAVMMILWLIYRFLLAQENQPGFNRVILLGIYLISFITPLLPYIQQTMTYSRNEAFDIAIEEISVRLVEPVEFHAVSNNTFATIIVMIYFIGVAVSLANTLIGALKICHLISRNGYQTVNGIKLVITDNTQYPAPFSFMNYIIISRKDYESSGAEFIITHEMQHIKLKHPADVMLAQLSVIFCWFNPASYLLRSELRDVHEYQADMAVLNSGADAQQYQILLIKKAVGKKFPAIANSLNHSKLKKRLTMMSNKKTSSRGAKMRALALVPALGVTILALNCTPVVNALSKISGAESFKEIFSAENNDKITANYSNIQITDIEEPATQPVETTVTESVEPAKETVTSVQPTTVKPVPVQSPEPKTEDETKVFSSVQQMPQFPGGERALLEFVAKNIRFPDNETIEDGKSKRVVVSFVVNADGKVGDVKIIRGVSDAFNNEAIRVVKMLPDFIPGKENGKNVAVWYSLPISFKQKSNNETSTAVNNSPKETGDKNVLSSVQQMPQFPGGEIALLEFVMRNIKYPENETLEGGKQRVIVSFVVEADGKVGDVKIIRGISDAFNNEAIRVIKMLPDFIPGKENGKNVAVWYNLPITFRSMDNQEKAK